MAQHWKNVFESTIDSEGFKGGTRGAPIMPRDAVSRTANVERTGRHKWVNNNRGMWFFNCTGTQVALHWRNVGPHRMVQFNELLNIVLLVRACKLFYYSFRNIYIPDFHFTV